VALVLEDGREVLFHKPGEIAYAPAGEFGVLAKNTDHWTYTSKANEIYRFNDAGLLTRIDKPYGYVQFSRVDGRVDASDQLGNTLNFTERQDGQPLTLQVEGWQIQYTYDANSNLIKVARQKAGLELAREYHYEDSRNPRLLTGITDERGIRFATWSYDVQGRGISSEHAGGVEKVNITYNADGTVTVINEFGKAANYKFAFASGMKRIIEIKGEPSPNCIASNSKFYYSTSGFLNQITDGKGNRTYFYYDNRGLETQRIEALGTSQARTINTEWHPTLPLPVKVTEPTRITTYTYDARGRQVGKSVTPR
jgi:YD repeat-containing protein